MARFLAYTSPARGRLYPLYQRFNVGCNYSVHPALTLQVRAAYVVRAWLTGMPPSGLLPGLRGYFAEPSPSGKHSIL